MLCLKWVLHLWISLQAFQTRKLFLKVISQHSVHITCSHFSFCLCSWINTLLCIKNTRETIVYKYHYDSNSIRFFRNHTNFFQRTSWRLRLFIHLFLKLQVTGFCFISLAMDDDQVIVFHAPWLFTIILVSSHDE